MKKMMLLTLSFLLLACSSIVTAQDGSNDLIAQEIKYYLEYDEDMKARAAIEDEIVQRIVPVKIKLSDVDAIHPGDAGADVLLKKFAKF